MKRRSKRGLAAWLTTSSTPIFLLDDRMVLLVFNHGCERMTGWSAGDVIGQQCQFVSHGAPDKLETLLGTLCPPPSMSSRSAAIEFRTIHHREGKTTETHIAFFSLEADDANPKRVLGIISDFNVDQHDKIVRSSGRHFDLSQIQANLFRRFGFDSIVAQGHEMLRVAAQIKIASDCDESVFLTGEPGTGKSHIARTIHHLRPDNVYQFIEINCEKTTRFEINRTLKRLRSSDQPLTVLLKRIEDLPRDLQTVAQTVMNENRLLRWMGTSRHTQDDLRAMDFSAELLCSLSSIQIHLPPLRDRREEILPLAQFLGEELNIGRATTFEGLTQEVEEEFLKYSWPGNVRELLKILDEAVRRADGPQIELEDLPVEFRIGRDNQQLRPAKSSLPLEQYLQEIERARIEQVLLDTSGNRTAAAEILGIPRAKLYRRMTALGLEEADADDEFSESRRD